MTITPFDQAAKDRLLSVVAQDFPIYVLGPGCYRVGFDEPDSVGWNDIEHRVAGVMCRLKEDEQLFMREFFLSKLSYERRSGQGRIAAANRLDSFVAEAKANWDEERELAAAHYMTALGRTPRALESFQPWRTLLAAEILRAYRHTSCLLGLVIGEGHSPVIHWQEASVPIGVSTEWARAGQAKHRSQPFENQDAHAHFLASKSSIRTASRLAWVISEIAESRPITKDQFESLSDLALTGVADLDTSIPASLLKAIESPVQVLLPLRISMMLEVLADRCFDRPSEALHGSNVEWLGDLLWHVISSDAEVQHSQSELAFYVTLSEQSQPQLADLRRAIYGDRSARDFDVTRLTLRSQPEDGRQNPQQSIVLQTIARCVLAQHQTVKFAGSVRDKATKRIEQGDEYTKEERKYIPALDLCVIALLGDYGDSFERTIFELLSEEDRFHIAIPVWVTSGSREIDWLLATAGKDGQDRADVTWSWLAEAQDIVGPIAIRLNGCDRTPLGGEPISCNVSEFAFEFPTRRHDQSFIELAVLYDEHDRLTAMQSLDELTRTSNETGGLLSSLSNHDKGLSWQGRSWVIMGQRFADWIPRLSLFTRKWAGSKDSKPIVQSNHVAFDRAFDWPERSLLDSLGITMIQSELGTVVSTLTVDAFEDRRNSSILGRRFSKLLRDARQG